MKKLVKPAKKAKKLVKAYSNEKNATNGACNVVAGCS